MADKKTKKEPAKKVDAAGKTQASNNKSETKAPEQAATSNNALPMFYNDIATLNKDAHGDLKLVSDRDYSFAKEANSIVLAASEFAPAAMHYPIVFGKFGDDLSAFAVTGHTGGQNVFINEKNEWRPETYIPAYVRRYPFILVQNEDATQFSLAADTNSARLSKTKGDPIYQDGEVADTGKRALSFCVNYRNELLKTKELLKAIKDSGILEERSAEVTLPGGEKQRIVGFSIVNEQKLAELSDEEFLKLRKNGVLNLIYCHLWSMRVWQNLLD